MPNTLDSFRESNPEVEFLCALSPRPTSRRMLARVIDVGFLRLPIGVHSTFDVVTVHRDRSYSWCPRPTKTGKGKRCLSEGERGEGGGGGA